jgi:acetolactate synthase-1/2/3 large subunit
MDSSPVVALTGNVAVPLLGKDSFQEVDIAGITMPSTKHNFIVKDVSALADTVRSAFRIARSGRPGPVLVDIPRDVTVAICEYAYEAPAPLVPETKRLTPDALGEAARLINESEKPLIYAGGGVVSAGAADELQKFARAIDAPVCVSAMGLGGFPGSDERFAGMVGMHGTVTANTLVTECDLLIAAGARFSDRVAGNVGRFAKGAHVLHLDVDPAEINKNVLTTFSLIGDVKAALSMLNALVRHSEHPEWRARMQELKEQFPIRYKTGDGVLRPQQIIECIGKLARENDALITTEVGQHQMWACQYIKAEKPRRFITSGGLGTMGFGLGAAIGAAIANPGTSVINIAGDGCFRMNSNELATAVEYGVPLVNAVINNHALGMVRQWQSLFYGKRYSHTSLHEKRTDFVKLAEAYGAAAFSITKPEEIEETLRKAIALKAPVLVNCEVGDDDKVFPMVPPGKGIDEYVLEE